MVSGQTIIMSLEIERMEANLQRLRERMPEFPVSSVMLSRLLQHLGRGMAAMLEDRIRPLGLNETEFRVLGMLFSQPDGVAHPSDLCSCTSQSPANMTRITDALVARDLITRVPSLQDRRKLVLRITPQGTELVHRLLPSMHRGLREVLKDFSDEEQQRLIVQLKRISAALENAAAGGSEPAE